MSDLKVRLPVARWEWGRWMGEWKAQISLRVRQALRAEMEEVAGRERRKLGNVGTVLLEWGVEQLKAATA